MKDSEWQQSEDQRKLEDSSKVHRPCHSVCSLFLPLSAHLIYMSHTVLSGHFSILQHTDYPPSQIMQEGYGSLLDLIFWRESILCINWSSQSQSKLEEKQLLPGFWTGAQGLVWNLNVVASIENSDHNTVNLSIYVNMNNLKVVPKV